MQGIVLGFDSAASTGVIRGEDGKRYKFSLEDWRGAGTPKPQDSVDFESAGDDAAEIFLLKRSAGVDMSALSETAAKFSENATKSALKIGEQMKASLGDEAKRKEMGSNIVGSGPVQFALRRPALVLGGLILLGCFAPIASLPGKSFSLWAVMGFVSDIVDSLNQLGAFLTMAGGRSGSSDGSLFLMKLAPRCLYLLYAIPVFAGLLVYKEITAGSSTKYRLRAALAGLISPVLAIALMAGLSYLAIPQEAKDAMGNLGAAYRSPAFGALRLDITDFLGWGLYLIWISSALLLATIAGLVKPATWARAPQAE